jgi:hypothetical protein
MNADLIVLADGANVTAEGKLNVLGEFNVIFGRTLPVRWPLMYLVLRLECTSAEGRQHRLALRFINDDGEIVSPNFEADVDFGPQYREGMPHRTQLILPLANAQFGEYGTYELEVLVDNQRIGSRALHVLDASEFRQPGG